MTRNLKEFVNHAHPVTASSFPPPMGNEHVCILMGVLNGAPWLAAQLDSIAAQSHRDWSLILSDDGSTDRSVEVGSQFARDRAPGRAWLIRGPRRGHARNFLHLVRQAGPLVPYAAFADQDDVWLKYKLARALAHLKSVPEGVPGLYAARTMICDADLRQLRPSLLFRRPPCFANALVQSIGGGNTMVLNRAALDLLQDVAPRLPEIVSHDWLTYQLVSGAGGIVHFDKTPTLLYRQHGGNLIGSNDTLRASAARILQTCRGRYRDWNEVNIAALDRCRHWLTEEAHDTLDAFRAARRGPLTHRLAALRRSRVTRQRARGTAALWLAALLDRL